MKDGDRKHKQVYRDELKEHRGEYYVTYQPADSRYNFANVGLVFHDRQPSENDIRGLMEKELRICLTRFPIPVMVSSFDVRESLIDLADDRRGSHLMGYIDPKNGSLVEKWGLLENNALPAAHMTAEHLEEAYREVPFRRREDVVRAVDEDNRKVRAGLRIFRAFFIFVAVIPVAIELISFGVSWLGYLFQAVSISTGSYKIAKAAGWIKKSKSATDEAEKKRKMEHYYYHCERNPEAFLRLKCENFEREAKERTAKEAAEIARRAEKQTDALEPPQFEARSQRKLEALK